MNFTVIEFEDGLELVPNNWLNENNTCCWPVTSDRSALNKLVLSKTSPDNTWNTYTIIKIYCQAATYERGREKLKLAMEMSDIDTADETLKRSRHSRHSVIISSEDEGSQGNKMGKNKKRKKRAISDFHSEDGSDDEAIRKIPDLPQIPENFNPSGLAKSIHLDRLKINTRTPPFNKGMERSMEGHDDTAHSTPSSSRCHTPISNSSHTLSKDAEVKIMHKLNTLISITRTVLERQTLIEQSITALQQNTSDASAAAFGLTEFKQRFPLTREDDLLAFDEELKDVEFFNKMVVTLSGLGGTDIPNVTINIMRSLISNRVANAYSLLGKKKKKPFKKLNVFNLVVETVRKQRPGATEADIGAIIGSWLPQSCLRLTRELAKENQP